MSSAALAGAGGVAGAAGGAAGALARRWGAAAAAVAFFPRSATCSRPVLRQGLVGTPFARQFRRQGRLPRARPSRRDDRPRRPGGPAAPGAQERRRRRGRCRERSVPVGADFQYHRDRQPGVHRRFTGNQRQVGKAVNKWRATARCLAGDMTSERISESWGGRREVSERKTQAAVSFEEASKRCAAVAPQAAIFMGSE